MASGPEPNLPACLLTALRESWRTLPGDQAGSLEGAEWGDTRQELGHSKDRKLLLRPRASCRPQSCSLTDLSPGALETKKDPGPWDEA